ncbi:hypothetical protein [Neogemmobacter tilapiae]|uniref:Lipoprotein n=1 Tax=Neogemmobacter tilapiae TaxID=875041 RepID=A0A918TXE6_9RHOB|nr:hypothetical protein [Gemmobacter tilapiae]GHC66050.1 hypothetical protein GCM10007315_33390 [Gemmobacter tilapiae]
MRIFRLIAGLSLALFVAACGGADNKFAPEDQVQAARYVHDGPTAITLYTVLRKSNGSGAHSGLLINASERVMFDPAGSFYHPNLPERHDVHFGMSPKVVDFYIDYHARETFDVVEQTVVVPPGVAQLIYQRALANGATPKAMCANHISAILSGVPGFESIKQTWGPRTLMQDFDKIPGVQKRVITDDDADKNHGVLIRQSAEDIR